MDTLLVVGYSSFELGIFNEKDIKIDVIKKAVQRQLVHFLEDGLQWIIFTGQLGFEYWTLEVAKELQKEYDFQIATLFNFKTHGENWNEANQMKLSSFKTVEFIKYAYEKYENPGQLKQYQTFLLENTDGALALYDEENETKLKYLIDEMKNIPDYSVNFLRFEDLQEIAEEMNE